VNITVTLDDGADVELVVGELRRKGMSVDEVLGAIGVVGSVPVGGRAALEALDGVFAVEEDHTFQLPPL